jgi:hypothetical protein
MRNLKNLQNLNGFFFFLFYKYFRSTENVLIYKDIESYNKISIDEGILIINNI